VINPVRVLYPGSGGGFENGIKTAPEPVGEGGAWPTTEKGEWAAGSLRATRAYSPRATRIASSRSIRRS